MTYGLTPLGKTPAQLTANVNNYDPCNIEKYVRLSSDATRTISGIANGQAFRELVLINVGSNFIVLANLSRASAAQNRIITGTGADITLSPDDAVTLVYDPTTQRWRVIA